MTVAPPEAPGTLAPAVRVLTRWTLEGVVLLHLDGGEPIVVTGPGAVLWSMLETGPARGHDLVAGLAARYGVEPGFVAHELEGVVGQLRDLGLVVIRDSEPPTRRGGGVGD